MIARNSDYNVGDKFIIEIGGAYWSPTLGNKYFIKGYNTLVFDDNGLKRLKRYEEPPKEVPHTCENCYFKAVNKEIYPCAVCENNCEMEPRDMFTKAE